MRNLRHISLGVNFFAVGLSIDIDGFGTTSSICDWMYLAAFAFDTETDDDWPAEAEAEVLDFFDFLLWGITLLFLLLFVLPVWVATLRFRIATEWTCWSESSLL